MYRQKFMNNLTLCFSNRKLKAAKEKLRRLRDLVSMVQKSPDVVHALPDDLADLAAEFDSDDISALAVMSQQAAAAGASRIAQQVSKDTFLPEIL